MPDGRRARISVWMMNTEIADEIIIITFYLASFTFIAVGLLLRNPSISWVNLWHVIDKSIEFMTTHETSVESFRFIFIRIDLSKRLQNIWFQLKQKNFLFPHQIHHFWSKFLDTFFVRIIGREKFNSTWKSLPPLQWNLSYVSKADPSDKLPAEKRNFFNDSNNFYRPFCKLKLVIWS